MISALLFAAAAASFTAPSFTQANAAELEEAYGGGEAGAVLIDAKVDPQGRITECRPQSVQGSKALAADICSRVERLRVKPASIGGRSSFGVVRTLLTFSDSISPYRDKAGAIKQPADMEVQVNKLPAGQTTLRVGAAVLVDATGKPQACYVDKDAPQAYADVACTQVSGVTFGTLKDDAGKPVSYVRSMIVDFELASASPASGG
jgi:hypothetical protein